MAETKPTQYRLKDDTLREMDAIMAHYALPSRAAAIAMAVRELFRRTEIVDALLPKKKSAKKKG